MSVEAALSDWLIDSTPIAALVGTRVMPVVSTTPTTLPRITYNLADEDRIRHIGGSSGAVTARFEIACWDDDEKGAYTVMEAVRNRLDGLQGVTIGPTGEDVYVFFAQQSKPRAVMPAPIDGREVGVFGFLFEVRVGYRESVPTLT